MKLIISKKVLVTSIFSFAILLSCGKKQTQPQEEPINNVQQEDISSANSMNLAYTAMSHYNDSLQHHAPDQHHINHFDSLYHHHDSLYWHHHTQYHHQDTAHHVHHPINDHHLLDSLHHHHDILDSLNHMPHHHSH